MPNSANGAGGGAHGPSYPTPGAVPIAAPTPEITLPVAMRAAQRWVVHIDKQPFYVDGTPRRGALDSPEDWGRLGTFDQAIDALSTGNYSGLGFALGPDGTGNCWQGIDGDHVPPDQLEALLNWLPGFAEVSPSGHGFHAIGYGRHFPTLGSNGSNVEAYAGGRYFTVTGDRGRGQITCLAGFVETEVARRHALGRLSAGSSPSAPASVDTKTVTELRSALLSMRSDEYDLWIRLGHALKELGEVGRKLWLEWSSTSDKFNAREATKKWDTFQPRETGYAAVFAEAQRQGWINPNSNAARLPQVPSVDTLDGPALLSKLRVAYDTEDVVDVPDIVEDLVADEELTLLGGHGGIGKSYLALQLACCVALGKPILGKQVAHPRRVMYYSAEDGRKRITRRARRIARELGVDLPALLANLVIVDGTEQQPLYGETTEVIESDDGKSRPWINKAMGATVDFEALSAMVQTFDAELLIIDGASDTYDGNEIARREVRAFIRLMQRVHPARRIGVLLLVHVDRSSARGNVTADDGYSGSSQWHNAARRRLYLRADKDTLWLKVMKNQDGPPAPDIPLKRVDGVLVPQVSYEPDRLERKADASSALLRLIDEYHLRGQSIGTSLAPQSTTGVYKTLKDDPAFPKGLDFEGTCQLVREAQRMGALKEEEYEYARGKRRTRWRVAATGTGANDGAGSAQSES